MLAFSIKEQGLKETRAALGRLQRMARPGGLRPVLKLIGAAMQRESAQTFRSGKDPVTGTPWPKSAAAVAAVQGDAQGRFVAGSGAKSGGGRRTLLDTGALRNSIVSSPPVVSDDSVTIGSALPYAVTHQEGGVIRPKRSRMLAIPVSREAKLAGYARVWWRQNPGAFIISTRSGGKAIAVERNGVLSIHYILKPSVVIPRRRFLGMSDRLAKNVAAIAKRALERALEN